MKKYEIIWKDKQVSIGFGFTLEEVLLNLGYKNPSLCYYYIEKVITTLISSEV